MKISDYFKVSDLKVEGEFNPVLKFAAILFASLFLILGALLTYTHITKVESTSVQSKENNDKK